MSAEGPALVNTPLTPEVYIDYFGRIVFKLFDLDPTFLVSLHNLLTVKGISEFWSIPPHRTGGTESGL